jgi:hypothetical protein
MTRRMVAEVKKIAGDWTYDAVSIGIPARFTAAIEALEPDNRVLGEGNVKKLEALPPHCRACDNANAFRGGFRLWGEATLSRAPGLIRVDAHRG